MPTMEESLAEFRASKKSSPAQEVAYQQEIPDQGTFTDRGFFSRAYEDVKDTVGRWATGAVQGAKEVVTQGNALADSNPLALSGTPMQEGMTNAPAPIQTTEQQQNLDTYKQATYTLANETAKPVVMPAALVNKAASVVALPFMADDAIKAYNEGGGGVEGVKKIAWDFTLGGAADFLKQPDLNQQMHDRPISTMGNGFMAIAAPLLIGKSAIEGITRIREAKKLGINRDGSPIIQEIKPVNGAGKTMEESLAEIRQVKQEQKPATAETVTKEPRQLEIDQNVEDYAGVDSNTKVAANLFGEELKSEFGIDALITSGKRSAENNAAVNGSPTSHHLSGKAVDLYVGDITAEQQAVIKQKALDAGWGEVLYHDAGTGVHLHLADFTGDVSKVGKVVESAIPKEDYLKTKEQYYNENSGDHAKVVEDALKEGKIIPERVAIDYPALAEKYPEQIIKTTDIEYSRTTPPKQGGISTSEQSKTDLLNKAHEAAMKNDYESAYNLARESGDTAWENAFKLLRDTNGGAEPLPPKLGGSVKGEYSGETILKKTLLERAREIFTPIRTGRIGKSGVEGFINHKNGVIRSRTYGDLDTISHEVGHLVDAALKLRKDAGAFDGEFTKAVHERFGEGAYEPAQVRGEGIAEFMKDYVTNPELAKQTFPNYYSAFEEALAKNADVSARVKEYKDMIQSWNNQSPEARGRSGVAYEYENKAGIAQKIKEAWFKTQEQLFDDKVGLARFTTEYEKIVGKKLATENDPYKMGRLSQNSATARAQMLVEGKNPEMVQKVLNKFYGDSIKNPVTMAEILDSLNDPLLKANETYLKNGNFKDWHEALDTLLVSRRQIELHKINIIDNLAKAEETLKVAQKKAVDAIAERIKAEALTANPLYPKSQLEIGKFKELEQKAVSELNQAKKAVEDAKNKTYHTPIEMADAEYISNHAPKLLHEIAEKAYRYNDNILSILAHEGLVKPEVYEALSAKYKNYISMAREFVDEASMERGMGMGKGFGNVRNALKKISEEGSARSVISPLESMVKNTYSMINLVERNRVGKIFSKLAEETGVGKLVEEVAGNSSTKDSTFSVWEKGEKRSYQTTPDLYRAIMTLNQESSNMIMKILSKPAGWLRAGATLTPDFALKNFARDSFSALVFTRNGFVPVIDHFKGLASLLKKDEIFHEYKASGALMSMMTSLDRDYTYNSIQKVIKGEGWKQYNPIELARAFSEAVETSTRLGEYAKARSKGVSIADAALSAKDITLDFSKAGVFGKSANKIVPFFNAAIQEPARLVQAFKEDPGGTSARIGLYITAPSVLLWTMNHDQDWYKELPQYQKDLFWIFKAGETVYRVPKPFGLGVFFGSGPERMLDYFYDKDQKAISRWAKTTFDAFMPNIMPTVFSTISEWHSNYSTFLERNIVPQKELKLPNAMQYGPDTSTLAKFIGEKTDTSPRKLDYLATSLGGGMARQALNIADAIKGDRPYKNPYTTAFTIDPTRSPQSVQDFYEELNKAEKDHNAGKLTKTLLTGDSKAKYEKLMAANKTMSALNKQEREVLQSTKYSTEEKQAKVTELNLKQMKVAQDALKKIKR